MRLLFQSLLLCLLFISIHAHLHETIDVDNLQIQVRETKSNKVLGKFGISSGEKFSKLLRLDQKLAAKFTFAIRDKDSGTPIEAIQQAFLRLSHSKAVDHEVFFVAKPEKKEGNANNGYYTTEIMLSRDVARFVGRPGRYNCELLVGDRRFRTPFRWTFIDTFVDIPKANSTVFFNNRPIPKEELSYKVRDRDPKLAPLPELNHSFKPIETCNLHHWPLFYIFTFFSALPLFLLIASWRHQFCAALFSLAQTSPFFGSMFFTCFTSILALYFLIWLLGWQLVFTLRILPFLGIPCFLAGHFALNSVSKERSEIEKELPEDETMPEIVETETPGHSNSNSDADDKEEKEDDDALNDEQIAEDPMKFYRL